MQLSIYTTWTFKKHCDIKSWNCSQVLLSRKRNQQWLFIKFGTRSHRDVIANVQDSELEVSKFETQLQLYAHIRTNTLWKGIKPLMPPHTQLWI